MAVRDPGGEKHACFSPPGSFKEKYFLLEAGLDIYWIYRKIAIFIELLALGLSESLDLTLYKQKFVIC